MLIKQQDLEGIASGEITKLKELGLTESLSTGYRLSPRGLVLWTILKT